MITWSDGTTSLGSNHLEEFSKPIEVYAFECDNFTKGLWSVRVYISSYFSIITDFFRTEEEAQEFMQFIRDLFALRFPDANEVALSHFNMEN